ncbi:hypothetical protein N7462_000243 [Penicillium macrosclerotiorum]|uniref:uncharacterized protein n=1 Tax=Penicillium macrosclerotiorum TaxID=303699 RepID=UPI002546A49F|nr:uncharacterized protein N7462_000243 [Penicillium macrosclerotiorum]KAJ5698238.1 hypothetical protein N7462_000243 [Penicillium macrosclerotiorum]
MGSHWPWIFLLGSSSTSYTISEVATTAYSPQKTDAKPSYGNHRYYAGGARTPYQAGTKSTSGITPFLLPATALAFFPGVWLWSVYAYPFGHPYYYAHDNKNESIPVTCLCEEYQECGCDDNNNSTYYTSLLNGTQPRNTSNVRVVTVNGTEKMYINGTLANGTTVDDGTTSGAPAFITLLNASGYWVMVAVVAVTVFTI